MTVPWHRAIWGFAAAFGVLSFAACTPHEQGSLPDVVDYNFHVKPILAEHCFLCHGHDAESRKKDLTLHTRAGLFAPLEGDSGRFVVVPGQPAASELIRRITSPIARERMPPPDAPHQLSDRDIAILRRWVVQGAEWKPHWAFLPPAAPAIPAVRDRRWPRGNLDRFVLARLEREGLAPLEEASRRTLIRRLYLDLTGLPPSSAEVRAFVTDAAPDAYERVVDRLLASPHYGERMALHWLDLARYADTNGYSIDGGRHMWIWRDWVIAAFNENKPFDVFVTEQLAGDLLPDPTEAQHVATGFHRNHMITHEGGTIPEENLTNYVADRVKTTGEVFLGLTLACAQCHDHKYDPISQRDYYRLFSFFNTIEERGLDGNSGINPIPSMEATTALATDEEIAAVEAALASVWTTLSQASPDQAAWEVAQRARLAARGRGLALHALKAQGITTPNSGFTGEIQADGSVRIAQPAGFAAYNVTLTADALPSPVTGLRIVFYPSVNGHLGHGPEGGFVLTSVHVTAGAQPSEQVDPHLARPIRWITATSARDGYPALDALDHRRINGWSPLTSVTTQHVTLTLAEPLSVSEARHFTVMLNFGQGSNQIAGHFRVYAMEGEDDGSLLVPAVQEALLTAAEERTAAQDSLLQATFFEMADEAAHLRFEEANLAERLKVLTEPFPTMVMVSAASPRPTHVLHRGQYDQPTELVTPGVPAFLPPLAQDSSLSRLAFAQWLFRPDHPLTARVAVNRFWQLFFGRGLVATPADFGARGALPSHPALLDYLATSFVASGYDVKALVKQIVLSATYRQSSDAAPALLALDPNNALLARGARYRLPAELIRDGALKVSGLLVPRLGGPSVHPYQPPGLWKEVSHYGSTPATAQTFVQDHGEKLYRRSLYTYWKRTAPPPAMMMFDAPTREVCTVAREQTNTPLQALVLLNDPQFVEASRAFAERILQVAPDDRIAFAFEEATGHQADRATTRILASRLEEEYAAFSQDIERAEAYLSVGESRRNEALNLAEHAAWSVVASLLLNLSETITRS